MSEEFVEDILAGVPENSKETPESLLNLMDGDESPTNENNVDEPKVGSEAESEEPNNVESAPVDESKESKPSLEEIATKLGWQANYKGKDAVDAVTYILKSREIQDTMKEHNDNLKNQLSTMQSSIEMLKDHNERVYQADVKRMQAEINALKKQKQKAVELADVAEVNAIDEQIDTLQKDLQKEPKEQAPKTDPIYDAWIKDNQWYLKDQEMAIYAENVAQQYQGAPLDRLYKIITQKVAEVFPEKFAPTPTEATPPVNKPKPVGPVSPVEAPVNKGKTTTFTKANLTPNQLAMMNQFVSQGIMTEEKYINDIAKMQEL